MRPEKRKCPRCEQFATFKVKTRQFGDGLERKYYECRRCKHMDTISYTNREIRAKMEVPQERRKLKNLFSGGKRVRRMMDELKASIETQ